VRRRNSAAWEGSTPAALAALAVLALPTSAAVAALVGLPGWQVLAVAVLAPMAGSLLLLAVLVLRVRKAPSGAPTAPDRMGSPVRQLAQAELHRCLERLASAVQHDVDSADLIAHALSVHEARLRWARVLLAEDGELPPEVADELLVAHRGVAALLRAQVAGRPDDPSS
jgi:hypothetical protein